jgi:hypothetical protein
MSVKIVARAIMEDMETTWPLKVTRREIVPYSEHVTQAKLGNHLHT